MSGVTFEKHRAGREVLRTVCRGTRMKQGDQLAGHCHCPGKSTWWLRGGGAVEKGGPDSDQIRLKTEPERFPPSLNVGWEGKNLNRVKITGLSTKGRAVPLTEMGKTVR